MALEWVVLVLPVVFLVWLLGWIWGRRVERVEVSSTVDELRNARIVTVPTHVHWSGRGVYYSLAAVLTAALALGAFGGVVWGFAVGPSNHETMISLLFAALCVFGTGAALLIWQFRAAVIVPIRIRAVAGQTGGIVFASEVTPSVRKFFGDTLLQRHRGMYLCVEEGLSFWIDGGSTMVEIGRVPKDEIVAVRLFGLPRSAGVDEAVVQVRLSDGRTSNLNIKPFRQAFDQARALNIFLASVRVGSKST